MLKGFRSHTEAGRQPTSAKRTQSPEVQRYNNAREQWRAERIEASVPYFSSSSALRFPTIPL